MIVKKTTVDLGVERPGDHTKRALRVDWDVILQEKERGSAKTKRREGNESHESLSVIVILHALFLNVESHCAALEGLILVQAWGGGGGEREIECA